MDHRPACDPTACDHSFLYIPNTQGPEPLSPGTTQMADWLWPQTHGSKHHFARACLSFGVSPTYAGGIAHFSSEFPAIYLYLPSCKLISPVFPPPSLSPHMLHLSPSQAGLRHLHLGLLAC